MSAGSASLSRHATSTRWSRTRISLAVGVVVALAGLISGCGAAQQAPAAPGQGVGTKIDGLVSSHVADLPLVNQRGRQTSLAAYAGKVVVIYAGMTMCQESCPLDTTNIVDAARAVDQAGLSNRVRFLTITVDPKRDRPRQLAAYRALYTPPNKLPNWDLLTGSQANIGKLWKYFGVFWRQVPSEHPAPRSWLTGRPLTYDVQHADVVLFLDANQHERFVISGIARVGSASMIPERLRTFLSSEGHHNVMHPGRQTWTVPQVVDTVSWLTGHHVATMPSTSGSSTGSSMGSSDPPGMGSGNHHHSGPGVAGMAGMAMPTAPLGWHSFFTWWEFSWVWDLVIVALGLVYLVGQLRARSLSKGGVPWYRACMFYSGLAVLAITLNSSIEGYGHILFWMHMVQHLLLIMVVPALLVAGSPLTLLLAATQGAAHRRVRSILDSRAMSLLTHPLTGLAIYSIIIVSTHLTSFMQQMLTHMWIHQSEQVLYLIGGFIFLLPILGDEPIRWRLSHLLRIGILFIAMAPDTVVGLVLLQTNSEPFPAYADMHRTWGPSLVHDIQTGGGIMWAFGDGLMMTFIVCLVCVYLWHNQTNATAGTWLENVRRATLSGEVQRTVGDNAIDATTDIDSDDLALANYNAMLRRLNERADGD
ncbi:MAG: cytochrome c oxidase assembly protein [Nocardioidaceae bacterium]